MVSPVVLDGPRPVSKKLHVQTRQSNLIVRSASKLVAFQRVYEAFISRVTTQQVFFYQDTEAKKNSKYILIGNMVVCC